MKEVKKTITSLEEFFKMEGFEVTPLFADVKICTLKPKKTKGKTKRKPKKSVLEKRGS